MAIMEHITPFTHHRRLQEELHDDIEMSLTCNTEKDRHIRLNERTAGMHDTNQIMYVHLHFIILYMYMYAVQVSLDLCGHVV